MIPLVFVTFAAVTLSPSSTPRAVRARPAAARYRSDELYSLRARRRFATYLRMRLLELRQEGLSRAADAVERRIPVQSLVPALNESSGSVPKSR